MKIKQEKIAYNSLTMISPRLFSSFLFVGIFSLFVAPIAFAGGGAIQPINFQHEGFIEGTSYEFVVKLNDFSSAEIKPRVGVSATFEAHHDLPNSSCTMTQGTSDSSGQVKARCSAGQTGKFSFDVKTSDGDQVNFTVRMQEPAPKPSPSPTPTAAASTPKPSVTPSPKPSVTPSPKASPKPSVSPSPKATATPSAQPTTMPTPSPAAASPIPTVTPQGNSPVIRRPNLVPILSIVGGIAATVGAIGYAVWKMKK